jgi:deoxyguanosine kinase
MNFDKYKYIVVEGPTGVGKTALARKIAESLGARTLLERTQDNPFLEKFFHDATRYALGTQLSFLFQRMRHLHEASHNGLFNHPVVSDFLLEKDRLFAPLTLGDDELKLYQQLNDYLQPQATPPDLVIYLQATPDMLTERLKKRGHGLETVISELYLQRLCENYSRFFYDYAAAPLLTVNTDHLHPVDSNEDYDLLLTHIKSMRGKREFFNRGA